MTREFVPLTELFSETPTDVALHAAPPAHAGGPVITPDIGARVAERYEVEGVIGEGGMGKVYRCRHVQLGRPFALKIMHDVFASDPRARELFYREARLASALSHPNIVSVFDYGEDPRYGAFMVMELVEGDSLLIYLQRGMLPLKQSFDIVHQVGEALHYAHQHDIIHCDIKPENVLLAQESGYERRRQVVKLLDFGLARLGTGARSQRLDGTPDYLAPEKILGHGPRPSMDVYGLGVLLFMLVTGRAPFYGTVEELLQGHLRTPPPNPSAVRKRQGIEPLDEATETLVLKALEKDPAYRHKDMGVFLQELRAVMDSYGLVRRRRVRPKPGESETGANLGASERQMCGGALFEMASVPLAAVTADGVLVLANRAFRRFVAGSEDADVLGLDLSATRLAKICPDFAADLRRVHMQGGSVERRFILRSQPGAAASYALKMAMILAPGPARTEISGDKSGDGKQTSSGVPISAEKGGNRADSGSIRDGDGYGDGEVPRIGDVQIVIYTTDRDG